MDYMEKIAELRAKKSQLAAEAEQLVTDGKYDEVDEKSAEMEKINANIVRLEKLHAEAAKNARPVDSYDGILHSGTPEPKPSDKGAPRPFATLGEQLRAVYLASKGKRDERLDKVNAAALGTNGGTGADGGFLLQEDFAGMILESAVKSSPLLNRLDRYTCSSNANAMRWLHADETDVSASVFGGVQMYWAAEAATVAASKPQFREMKLDLEKMMGFAYCADEMLEDASFLSGFLGNAFSLAADRLLIDGVLNGDGVGKPVGILKSDALIEVAKESGQAAGTFVGANAIKMQARSMPRNRDKLVWLMHPDLEEQLPYLALQSGEAAKFLWNPEGGLGGFDTQRVLNKPVLYEDSCAAVGSRGDVLLIDPTQYILLVKGTARQDWSVHVEFLTAQNCFRMIFRCNGAPKVNTSLTIKNSTKTRSPFITLAARS